MVAVDVNEVSGRASAANALTFVTLQVGEDLLDRFLKSDPLKAVEELIWNALDAEATEVIVKIEEQTEIQGLSHIEVRDNGHGMQPEKCHEYFGYQGNSWKKARHRSLGGLRPVLGRHGEGRLFALGLSSSPTWTSVADDAEGRRVRSVVRTSRLSPNRAEILPATATDEQIGTVVDLPALQVSAEISRHLGVLVSDRAYERLLLPLAAYLLAFPTTRVVYRGRELKPQDDLVGQPIDIGMAIPSDSWPRSRQSSRSMNGNRPRRHADCFFVPKMEPLFVKLSFDDRREVDRFPIRATSGGEASQHLVGSIRRRPPIGL